jgi:phosphohistidine phosphatase
MTDLLLVIMRHAKAEQSASLDDVDRALTERGHSDARAGGRWLAEQGITPDLVLCSPAVRCRGTWHEVAIGMAEVLAEDAQAPAVVYAPDLYDAGLSAALDQIRGVEAGMTTVLIIGHNPTMSALSHRLDDARMRAAGGLRTGGIAVHRVATAWADLAIAALTAEHTPRG